FILLSSSWVSLKSHPVFISSALARSADEVRMQSGLNSGLGRFVRIERHPLGARLHLAGFRFHEWHLGSATLLALGTGAALGRVDDNLTAALAGFGGVWLVAKDWHDLVPSRRDTAAWKLGLHRRPNPLRTFRRADPLPALAAIGAILVAIVNLVSALTPNMAWRGHALLKLEPLAAMRVSHALAIPVAWLLLVAGVYLGRRRRRAGRRPAGVRGHAPAERGRRRHGVQPERGLEASRPRGRGVRVGRGSRGQRRRSGAARP